MPRKKSVLPVVSSTRVYKAYTGMKQRCGNPRAHGYHNYGARGITVCQKWKTFAGFWRDMGATYRPGLTLERLDNSKGYSPSNCRWLTHKENLQNTRRAVRITEGGVTKTVTGWAEFYGIAPRTAHNRLRRGLPFNRVFTKTRAPYGVKWSELGA
jgi:hypothetical protein